MHAQWVRPSRLLQGNGVHTAFSGCVTDHLLVAHGQRARGGSHRIRAP